jgi:hypothetical protein
MKGEKENKKANNSNSKKCDELEILLNGDIKMENFQYTKVDEKRLSVHHTIRSHK